MAGIEITYKWDGAGAEAKLQRAFAALTPPLLSQSMGAGAEILSESVRGFVPVESGTLAGVISAEPKNGEPTAWIIGPMEGNQETTPYANIINEGGMAMPIGNWFVFMGLEGHFVEEGPFEIAASEYIIKGMEAGRGGAIEAVKAAVLAEIG